jgi:hypothetical protein
VRGVVQDRHIDDPTDPNAVGATDRPPEETAQKHQRIGDHSQYSSCPSPEAVSDPSARGLARTNNYGPVRTAAAALIAVGVWALRRRDLAAA